MYWLYALAELWWLAIWRYNNMMKKPDKGGTMSWIVKVPTTQTSKKWGLKLYYVFA